MFSILAFFLFILLLIVYLTKMHVIRPDEGRIVCERLAHNITDLVHGLVQILDFAKASKSQKQDEICLDFLLFSLTSESATPPLKTSVRRQNNKSSHGVARKNV